MNRYFSKAVYDFSACVSLYCLFSKNRIYWLFKQVLKKEKEVHLSVTENGGLNSKTTMTNEDNIGTGNVRKVTVFMSMFYALK